MKLKSLEIKNIMSVVNSGKCYIDDNILVLAGQNESGKTAILKSLNYFANGADDNFKKYAVRIDETPFVCCTFELEEHDYAQFPTEIVNVLKQIKEITMFRSGLDQTDLSYTSDTVSSLQEIIEQNYNILKNYGDNIFFETAEEKLKREATITQSLTEGTESEEIDNDAKKQSLYNNLIGYINTLQPSFVYYDSFSNLLPDEIALDDVWNNQAVTDLQNILNLDFKEDYRKEPRTYLTKIKRALSTFQIDFNNYWQQTFLDDKETYTIDINLIDNNKINFMIDRGNATPLYFSQKSKGFQWFNAFYLRLKAMGVDPNNLKNNLLLIDEPGQGLHESAQKDVMKVLEDLASKGLHIIYTTHHPLLINVEDHANRIRLVSNQKTTGTKVSTLSQFVSNAPKGQIQSDYTLSPIRTAMGLERIELANSGINVILEGITDKYYFDAFKLLLGINEDDIKIKFIPAPGAPTIKNIASILLGWGYTFKIVFDKHATVEKELKKSLFPAIDDTNYTTQVKMLEEKGIEDLFTVNDFKSSVLPENFEYDETKCNSDNAKNGTLEAKKEVIARLFLDKVRNGTITADCLDIGTTDKFRAIFDWLTTQN